MKTIRNPWPLAIILFFALFFSGIAAVITIAATHRESLVSKDYYEQEIRFQDQINAANRAQLSGASIHCDPAGRLITVAVPPEQVGETFSGTVELYRPSSPDLDRTFRLTPKADGTQTLDGGDLATGLWLVRIRWNSGGQDFFLEKKITLAGH